MNSNTKETTMRHNTAPGAQQDIPHELAEWALFDLCLETRGQDGVRPLVYLRDRKRLVSLDTCTDADLLAAAVACLTREREEISRTLEKAKKKLSGATNTEQLKQTPQSN